MALVRRDAVPEPRLEHEVLAVPELGGEVEVRALSLEVLQQLLMQAGREPHMALGRLLEATVRADDGEPLWTADKWFVWGGGHLEAVMRLYRVAQRVCGIGAEAAEVAEGKSDSQPGA